jgi:hypothetical protein
MGVCFTVVCDDCKVQRDLDKMYQLYHRPKDRKAALESAKEDGKYNAFRAELLVSFMGEHMGHKCSVYDDLSWCEKGYPWESYKKEDFWTPYEGEKFPHFHKKKPWWRFWS